MNLTISANKLSGGFMQNGMFGLNGGTKSAQEKMERKQKAENQIAFFEAQKDNLKNRKCETLEEIARKLDAFHTYEDNIAAVKASYNKEEMSHILDEARELGEKIAKAAEKLEPKTAEERREDMAEEALGIDESEGVLDEMMDEINQMADAGLTEEMIDTEALKGEALHPEELEKLSLEKELSLEEGLSLEKAYRPFEAYI